MIISSQKSRTSVPVALDDVDQIVDLEVLPANDDIGVVDLVLWWTGRNENVTKRKTKEDFEPLTSTRTHSICTRA